MHSHNWEQNVILVEVMESSLTRSREWIPLLTCLVLLKANNEHRAIFSFGIPWQEEKHI